VLANGEADGLIGVVECEGEYLGVAGYFFFGAEDGW